MSSKVGALRETARDPLTGMPDGQAVLDALARWRDEAGASRAAPVHAMMIGLGRFDAVNLAYGEATGDGALVEVARRIGLFAADELAEGEWVASRLSGGTFALAARDAMSRERWQWLGEALVEAMAAPIAARGAGAVRLWPRAALLRVLPGEGGEHVLDRLAATLDRARDRAGLRLLWADRLRAPVGVRTAQLEADLLAAIDKGEIEVVFQPQYDCATDRLIGAEALARWRHPRVGLIGAGPLFALAERADHVAHLSRHIAEVTLAEAARWAGGTRLSLNITPADLASAGFADQFAVLIDDSGFAPDLLTLEITEQVLLGDLEQAAAMLSALKEKGVRISLDDFGGGFCNFRYLKLLPLDALKLDRSMIDGIDGIDSDPRDREVLRAIVAMARALGLTVVAEGIETEAQRGIVHEEACTAYQGFLRSKPLPASEFRALAANMLDPPSCA